MKIKTILWLLAAWLLLVVVAAQGDELCKPPHHVRCDNGMCIMAFFKCDGDNDCGDWSDEHGCNGTQTAGPQCMDDEFRCGDSTCIPPEWVCDGSQDCEDGSDEVLGCSKQLSCHEDFQCDNHHCVPKAWQCDGNDDCGDGSDEMNCHQNAANPDCDIAHNLYACRDGLHCIELNEVCDGRPHCLDASDEGLLCQKSKSLCATKGCSFKCQPTPNGPLCLCPPGFALAEEKYCRDVNECLTYGICSQKCNNTNGGYSCYCAEGYSMDGNNHTCTAKEGEAVLLFSTKSEVRAYFMKNKVYITIADNLNHIAGVGYDGSYIYWTSVRDGEEAIMRSNTDGSVIDVLVTSALPNSSGLSLPEDLALDLVTGNIYFTDGEESYIGVCTKTGKECAVVVNEDVLKPRGIALLVQKGQMFWSDWGHVPKIATAGMDGSFPRVFVSDVEWPNGITIDLGNERLYWVDAKLQTIESVALDGSDRRIVLKDVVKHPYSIAVFEDTLYWSDWHGKQILSCNKYTGKEHKILVRSRKNHIYGISIFHPVLHPQVRNPCDGAGCSDICMLALDGFYACACPEGKQLAGDEHTCIELGRKLLVVAAAGNRIVEVEHKILGKQSYSVVMPTGIQQIDAITYSPVDDMLILADNSQRKLFTLSLATMSLKTLIMGSIGWLTSMDFDAYGNNLYWTDSERNIVEVMSMATKERTVLLRGVGNEAPRSIAVVPEEGLMFVACGLEGKIHIDKMLMDGSGKWDHSNKTGIKGPEVSLWYESGLHEIFWADGGTKTIGSFPVDGDTQQIVQIVSDSPVAIASVGQDLFWTVRGSSYLYWANKYISDGKVKRVILDMEDTTQNVRLTAVKGVKFPPTHPCHISNGGCSHLCLLRGQQHVCGCPEGMKLQVDSSTCAANVCKGNEYQCEENKKCIPAEFRCNGVPDCPGADDEKDCMQCRDYEFRCDSGQCISSEMKCDGREQCRDGSDEMHCERIPCLPDQFKCKNGDCIDRHMRCDTMHDCEDNSDEENCAAGDELCKPPHHMRCDNGMCIMVFFKCDGDNDCGDWSDEHGCNGTQTAGPQCMDDEFRCGDSTCIPPEWVCDGSQDCEDGSDEVLGCSKQLSCHEDFQCDNHHCVPKVWQCDGNDDCGDGSDEMNCHQKAANPDCDIAHNLYACRDGLHCIELNEVCDGRPHCLDASDEGLLCQKSKSLCATKGCSFKCQLTPNGPLCLCPPGFALAEEKYCRDVNECLTYGICSQKCNNTNGGYSCYCAEGYSMDGNNHTCTAKEGEAVLLFSTKSEVRAYFMKNKVYITIADNLNHIAGVGYDGSYIYWTSVRDGEEAIMRSNTDGSVIDVLVTSGLSLPEDLALDLVTGNIYFTDGEESYIGVCTKTGKECAVVVNEDVLKPRGIALLVQKGQMFWSDWGHVPKIATAGMDGSFPRVFVSDVEWPNGITIDLGNERLYWVDAKLQTIESVALDGSDRRIVLKDVVKHPYSIAVFEDTLYWSDWHGKQILSCNKYTGKEHKILVRSRKNHIYGISIFHPVLHPQVRNPCDGAGCSDICMLALDGFYACACPEGKQLAGDEHTCIELGRKLLVVAAAGNRIVEVEHKILGKQSYSVVMQTGIQQIDAITYSPVDDMLILADNSQRKLFTLSLATMSLKTLIIGSIGWLTSMDFDAYGNNLYWTDSERNIVEVMSMATKERTVLMQGVGNEAPRSIAVVPEEGYMFVACGLEGKIHIDKMLMDGSGGRDHSIKTGIKGPEVSLWYESGLHEIFWADGGTKTIGSFPVDGDMHQIVQRVSDSPVAIASVGQDLFWTVRGSSYLYWANKYISDGKVKRVILDMEDTTQNVRLTAVKGVKFPPTHPCHISNGGCSHLCLLRGQQHVCGCPEGMKLQVDSATCAASIVCKGNEYQCEENKICIPAEFRCNGVPDCPGADDEKDCMQCRDYEFRCDSGQCISSEMKCDGREQCPDRSDEMHCERIPCLPDQFECKSGDCIDSHMRCDTMHDCEDNSDEENCAAALPTCGPHEFTCSNGNCIQVAFICDTQDDCGDGSDEKHCSAPTNENITCTKEEFFCSSTRGTCIPSTKRCDGNADCPKAEDEKGCGCDPQEFECKNGKCIASSWVCDTMNDCGDGSDEVPEMCTSKKGDELCKPPHHMRCDNGMCIMVFFQCDGDNDCGDWSDEHGCNGTQPAGPQCVDDEFRCGDSTCIPPEWVCDGSQDCEDGSDEVLGCSKQLSCHEDFQCDNHHCVPKAWQCDGNDDCGDGSDEMNCHQKAANPDCDIAHNLYACRDGLHCIELNEVCDGRPHCLDASDEGLLCQKSKSLCPTKGCSFKCQPTPNGPLCLCPPGFALAEEKYCRDVDECLTYGICSQKCNNTNGGYSCYCAEGYSMDGNNHTCTAKEGEAVLLFSTKSEVRAYFMKNKVYITIADNLNHIAGVGYDGSYIYWTSVRDGEEAIMRSNTDGSVIDVLVTSGLSLPEDLALDLVTGNIYFTDGEESYIGVCTKTGKECAVVVNEDVLKPRGIALLVQKGQMFWSDWGHVPKIATAGMDGSFPRVFVSDVEWPNGITIDLGNERLYWVDAKLQTIESVTLDGSDRRIVLKDVVKHPYSIAVFEDTLYWSDWHGKQILSCNKYTGKEHKNLVRSRKNHIYGISIFHPVLHPQVRNPCDGAGCSDICMLALDGFYACACPEGKQLAGDEHTCIELGRKLMVVAAAGNRIVEVEHKILGKQSYSVKMPMGIQQIDAITYSPVDDMLILADNSQRRLFTLSLATMSLKTLIRGRIGWLTSMDFDAYGNNLYWTDSERNIVEVMSMATKERTVLLRGVGNEAPRSIAVVPEEGYMFVACGLEGKIHIDKMLMDGSGKRDHSIKTGIKGPEVSLWYESGLHEIFWADGGKKTIGSFPVDGDTQQIAQRVSDSPVAIASVGQDLFWTVRGSSYLYWANKYISDGKVKRVILDMEDTTQNIRLTAVRGVKFPPTHPCHISNGGCSHLCLLRGQQHVCGCPEGMKLQVDSATCAASIVCKGNEYQCDKNKKCIPAEFRCNGVPDCPGADDEKDCMQCRDYEFRCDSGQCISSEMKCDGREQCRDGSDEMHCERIPCLPDQFECKNGDCIDRHMRCDTMHDCEDNSDEENCAAVTCREEEFRCETGTCIPGSWECDSEINCPDGSDEHDQCPLPTCGPHEFTCSNGNCIQVAFICDTQDDCGDGSDEKHCSAPTNENITCTKEEFFCSSTKGTCIPSTKRCDGNADCPKAEDERGCGCDPQEFECKNGKCIASSWVCDTMNDCGDGSDEVPEMCISKKGAKKCAGFTCTSGKCLELQQLCDGTKDCEDGSDEGGKCGSACKGSPCDGGCRPTPAGPQCYCEEGYELQPDGRSCHDINECLQHVCSQVCLNMPGSFRCACMPEYSLKLDKISCKAKGPPMEYVFVVSGTEIRKASHSFSHVDVVHRHTSIKVTGLDVDAREDFIYWSARDMNGIYSLSLKTRNKTLVTGLGKPTEIALDWLTKNVYYVNELMVNQSYVQVCRLANTLCARAITGEPNTEIKNLVVDPPSGLLFWTETSMFTFGTPSSAILSAEMSGANKQRVINSMLGYVSGLAVDPIRKRLFWADRSSNVIEAVNYSGENRQQLFKRQVENPARLVLFEDNLYWLSSKAGVLTRCPIFGVLHTCENIPIHAAEADYFTIIQGTRQLKGHNPCKVHNCSYLCVLSPRGAECLCPDGGVVAENAPCKRKDYAPSLGLNVGQRTILTKAKPNSAEGNGSLAAVLTVTFLILAIIGVVYYLYKRQMAKLKKLDVSVHFQNPGFGFQSTPAQKKPAPPLKPGEHEYVNPLQIRKNTVSPQV